MQNQTFRSSNKTKNESSNHDFAASTTRMFQLGLAAILLGVKSRLNPSLLDDSAHLLHSVTTDRTRVHFALVITDKINELELVNKKDLLRLLTLLEGLCSPLAARADANTKRLYNLLDEVTKQAGDHSK